MNKQILLLLFSLNSQLNSDIYKIDNFIQAVSQIDKNNIMEMIELTHGAFLLKDEILTKPEKYNIAGARLFNIPIHIKTLVEKTFALYRLRFSTDYVAMDSTTQFITKLQEEISKKKLALNELKTIKTIGQYCLFLFPKLFGQYKNEDSYKKLTETTKNLVFSIEYEYISLEKMSLYIQKIETSLSEKEKPSFIQKIVDNFFETSNKVFLIITSLNSYLLFQTEILNNKYVISIQLK